MDKFAFSVPGERFQAWMKEGVLPAGLLCDVVMALKKRLGSEDEDDGTAFEATDYFV